jgi:hypothetical protein
MTYTVWIDDNFSYMDKEKRYRYGDFETLDGAIEACKKIVDGFLASAYKSGMHAEALSSAYMDFGEDPWISGAEGVPFSAWNYVKQRSVEICTAADESTG